MSDLFRAFFFKLKKDLTFRITLIVGAGVAILMMLLNMAIDGGGPHNNCSGNSMLISSFNPAQNFGIAIPINLITFTVVEFSTGIIRNKIIAGNSKAKIYLSLFLTGLVFSLSLLFLYVGFSTLLGTIVGGFNPNGYASVGLAGGIFGTCYLTPDFIWKFVICNILVYISMTAFTIFIATLFRNVGPSIPVTILVPIILSFIVPLISTIPNVREAVGDVLPWLNPFQAIGEPDFFPIPGQEEWVRNYGYTNTKMIATTVCNLMWTAIFVGFGTLIFVKRDVK